MNYFKLFDKKVNWQLFTVWEKELCFSYTWKWRDRVIINKNNNKIVIFDQFFTYNGRGWYYLPDYINYVE